MGAIVGWEGASTARRDAGSVSDNILRTEGAGMGRGSPLNRESEGGRIDDIEDDSVGRIAVEPGRVDA